MGHDLPSLFRAGIHLQRLQHFTTLQCPCEYDDGGYTAQYDDLPVRARMATGRRLTPTTSLKSVYGANWSVNLAPGDYAVDDGVTSSVDGFEQCPAPAGRGYAWLASRQRGTQDCFGHRWYVEHDHGFGGCSASPVLAEQGEYIPDGTPVTYKGKPITGGSVIYELEGGGEGKDSPTEPGAGPLRGTGRIQADRDVPSYELSPASRGCPRDTTRSGLPVQLTGPHRGRIFSTTRPRSRRATPDVLGGRYSDPQDVELRDEVVKDRHNQPSFDLPITVRRRGIGPEGGRATAALKTSFHRFGCHPTAP